MTTPLEARCDHCEQIRPLFLYGADHDFHLTGITCEWCVREAQPLLCTRCWSAEKEREESYEGTPEDNALADFFEQAAQNNARIIAREEAQAAADRAACEGIAAATQQTNTPGATDA
ncbi:hypothetical protein OHR86_22520 [Streptomyces sp. NBC_00441]|uniref:hypothetical protein n=1 Tax=Streptomyces sp. NBC_00441 TaxID=2975742 RepID=UPI002E297865|nr:hypothetical protein [Streptomyces sp. NBC_00441]